MKSPPHSWEGFLLVCRPFAIAGAFDSHPTNGFKSLVVEGAPISLHGS